MSRHVCNDEDACTICEQDRIEYVFTGIIVESFSIRDYIRIAYERASFQYWMRRNERRVNRRGISGYRDW